MRRMCIKRVENTGIMSRTYVRINAWVTRMQKINNKNKEYI